MASTSTKSKYTNQELTEALRAAAQKLPYALRQHIDISRLKAELATGPTGEAWRKAGHVAAVEGGSRDTVKIIDPDVFMAHPTQLAAHEITHLIQNGLSPEDQAKFAPVSSTEPYNYGGTQGLAQDRAQGKRMMNLSPEVQAEMNQYAQAHEDDYAQGSPEGQAQWDAQRPIYNQYQNDMAGWKMTADNTDPTPITSDDDPRLQTDLPVQYTPPAGTIPAYQPQPVAQAPQVTATEPVKTGVFATNIYKFGDPAPGTPAPSANTGDDNGLPAGYTVDSTPQGAASDATGLPAGYTIDSTPQGPTSHSDEIQINPNDSYLTRVEKTAGGLLEGVGEGVFSTAAGAADLADKITGTKPGAIDAGLHTLAGDNNTQRGTAQSIGYGGETLMEFLLGDEALKALPLADKLGVASKITKTLQGSPRLMRAVQVGADVLKAGGRAGLVQGAQTLVRTGGDTKAAAEQGLIAAATGGAVEGATGALGAGLRSAGRTAKGVQDLTKTAQDAATRPEVAQSLGQRLQAADKLRHTEFENGINDLKDRLGDASTEKVESPIATRAQELLDNPDPDEDPDVAAAKTAAGDKLDKPVRDLLTRAANGGEMPAEEAEQVDTGLLDEKGKPIMRAGETEESEPQQWNIDNLIKYRQAIRKLSSQYDMGDINARALRQLLPSVDDTIDELAEQSDDATAGADYKALRNTYRIKNDAFNNPAIKALMNSVTKDGELSPKAITDAANAFVTQAKAEGGTIAGKKAGNLVALKTILSPEDLHAFGKQIVHNMLQDSAIKGVDAVSKQPIYGEVNPAKFMRTWNRVSAETKGSGLFDLAPDPGQGAPSSFGDAAKQWANSQNPAKRGLSLLFKDADAAAQLQRLSKAAIIGGAGAALGHMPIPAFGMLGSEAGIGLLGMLGIVSESGGGVKAGRNILDYLSDHPAVWAAYRKLGKAAANKAASATADVARVAAAHGAATGLAPATNKNSIKSTYKDIAPSLGAQ